MSSKIKTKKLDSYLDRIKNRVTVNKLISKLNYYIIRKKKEEYNKILEEI